MKYYKLIYIFNFAYKRNPQNFKSVEFYNVFVISMMLASLTLFSGYHNSSGIAISKITQHNFYLSSYQDRHLQWVVRRRRHPNRRAGVGTATANSTTIKSWSSIKKVGALHWAYNVHLRLKLLQCEYQCYLQPNTLNVTFAIKSCIQALASPSTVCRSTRRPLTR